MTPTSSMSFCLVTASATLPPMVPYPFTPTLIIVNPSVIWGI